MATITVTNELDILSKYEALVKESLGSESVYVRTKETIEAMFDNGLIKDDDKAAVISQVLSAINTSMVSTSMQTALQWAAQEKEIALKKLELEKQLDILNNDNALREAQVAKTVSEDLAIQASNLRDNGVSTLVGGKVVSVNDSGTKYENILATRAQVDKMESEIYAGIHKIVADTYANYGAYSGYVVGANGVTGITDITPVGYTTLSEAQLAIAKEQAKGYAYNAWANAASGLGSTIGVALTSETNIFTDNPTLLSSWRTTIENLRDVPAPTF
jgi:hypothetical protein